MQILFALFVSDVNSELSTVTIFVIDYLHPVLYTRCIVACIVYVPYFVCLNNGTLFYPKSRVALHSQLLACVQTNSARHFSTSP